MKHRLLALSLIEIKIGVGHPESEPIGPDFKAAERKALPEKCMCLTLTNGFSQQFPIGSFVK
jgi:hypothetical protein